MSRNHLTYPNEETACPNDCPNLTQDTEKSQVRPDPTPDPTQRGRRPDPDPPTKEVGHGSAQVQNSPYRSSAATLVKAHGWERATLVATAVRGYVYGSPNPGPYRDEAEAIYRGLGWEQSALLASWFRDARNQPGHQSVPNRIRETS